MNAQITELYRLLNNLIRTGVISAVDTDKWLCRVKVGELETTWINWLTHRAGDARIWWCPSVGEQVLLLSIGGNLETAFALPAIYSDQSPPPSTSPTVHLIEYSDQAQFSYDPKTGQALIRGIKSLRVEASDEIACQTKVMTIDAEKMQIKSQLVITGKVTQSGGTMSSNGVVVDKHQHSGVKAGGDTSGWPT